MITIECQCGETYRAEEQHIGKNIKCKRCGSILSIIQLGSSPPSQKTAIDIPQKKSSTSIDPYSKSESSEKLWWQKHLYSLIGTAVLLGIIIFILVLSGRKPQINPSFTAPSLPAQPPTIKAPQKELLPALAPEPVNPKRLPNGSSPFGSGIRNGHSTLTVDNGTESDAVIKVIRFNDREQLVRYFYIHNSKKWTAERLPPGQYVIRVAFGKDWNSKLRKFNFRRHFSETEVFDISETTSVNKTEEGQLTKTRFTEMRITLHKVVFGNFKSHEISEEDFDR